MNTRDNIHGMLVKLNISDQPALFVLLAADGTINRLGTGSVNNVENDLFIGVTDLSCFEQLRGKITDELLGWCGQQLADPDPHGEICELTVGFQQADGQSLMTAWRYGSESQGPPPEVCEFVIAAVKATEPWFQKQQAMVKGS
jgi:hypothetical protein